MKHSPFCNCGKCVGEMSIASRMIHGLREFSGSLERGEPIEATRVERFETPDGPMHIRRKVTI